MRMLAPYLFGLPFAAAVAFGMVHFVNVVLAGATAGL